VTKSARLVPAIGLRPADRLGAVDDDHLPAEPRGLVGARQAGDSGADDDQAAPRVGFERWPLLEP
jgi:hypothetical protein